MVLDRPPRRPGVTHPSATPTSPTSWSSRCDRSAAHGRPRHLQQPCRHCRCVPPDRPPSRRGGRSRDEALPGPERQQRRRAQAASSAARKACTGSPGHVAVDQRLRQPLGHLRTGRSARPAAAPGRATTGPAAARGPTQRPSRPELVAGAVDQQPAGREPPAQPPPDGADLVLVVLPQHVERPHQHRPAPGRAGPARSRRARTTAPAPASGARPAPAPGRSRAHHLDVRPDRAQPVSSSTAVTGARP